MVRRTRPRPQKLCPARRWLKNTNSRAAVRNPFYAGLPAGARRAVIAPDVGEVFADSALVNEALRLLIRLARERHAHRVEPGMAYGGWLATIEPDVAAVFGSSVSDALRALIEAARKTVPSPTAEREP